MHHEFKILMSAMVGNSLEACLRAKNSNEGEDECPGLLGSPIDSFNSYGFRPTLAKDLPPCIYLEVQFLPQTFAPYMKNTILLQKWDYLKTVPTFFGCSLLVFAVERTIRALATNTLVVTSFIAICHVGCRKHIWSCIKKNLQMDSAALPWRARRVFLSY